MTSDLQTMADFGNYPPGLIESVFRDSPDPMILVSSKTGRMVAANQAVLKALGYTGASIIDKPLDKVIPGFMPESTRPATRIEHRKLVHAEGKVVDFEVSTTRIFNDQGDVFLIRLSGVNDRSQEAIRAQNAFVANMSHEIRTPLNGIIGMTDLLNETELGEQQREYVDTIRVCSENLLALINDILDYSKLEAERVELEAIPFNLRQCLEEVLDVCAARAQTKGLDLILDTAPDLPEYVTGDKSRLQQVLLNLLSNAVKFTSEGEVSLSVQSAEAHTDRLLLSVRDSGIGIPAEAMDRLFVPFSQVDSSTTRQYGGTGLGLTISAHIVALMGSTLEVRSTPGRGSEFSFVVSLPTSADPAGAETIVRRASLRGLRAAVADPSPGSRRVLSDRLRHIGCQVTEHETFDSLRAALTNKPAAELAFVDLQLPGLTPESFAKAISAAPDGIQCVLVTTMPSRKFAAQYMDAGFATMVLKPVHDANILRIVDAMRQTGRVADASPVEFKKTTSQTAPREHAKILLVEDDTINQRLATLLLAHAGYPCEVASDGLQALERLEKGGIDLVLMDCQMPRMDGFTATRRWRERETPGNRIPILAMTANAMQGDRELCIAAGMDDYLRKPVQAKELFEMLATYLRTHNRAGSSPRTPVDAPIAAPTLHGPWEDEPLFDPQPLEQLLRLTGGTDPTLVNDMVMSLVTSFQGVLLDMRTQADSSNYEAVRSHAHMYQSRCGTVGAKRMQMLCREIEARIRDERYDSVAPLVDLLANTFRSTKPLFPQGP